MEACSFLKRKQRESRGAGESEGWELGGVDEGKTVVRMFVWEKNLFSIKIFCLNFRVCDVCLFVTLRENIPYSKFL